jgi:hypothetical protein
MLKWVNEWRAADYISSIALLVTGFFLLFTILTWKQMKRANEDAEKRSESDNENTQTSLKLTREGQDDTRSAFRAIIGAVRAWITIDSIETVTWYDNGVPDTIDVTFRNTGHSPAINVTLSGYRFVNRSDIIPGSPGPEDPQNIIDSNVPIGAGLTMRLSVRQPSLFFEDSILDVAEGRRSMFVAGGARYCDIFDATDRHVFQYAAKYDMGQAHWVLYR